MYQNPSLLLNSHPLPKVHHFMRTIANGIKTSRENPSLVGFDKNVLKLRCAGIGLRNFKRLFTHHGGGKALPLCMRRQRGVATEKPCSLAGAEGLPPPLESLHT
ncbi:hypothetical protein Q8A67_023888 [Cirrhinus molitorella]|uniref:Uncharacterized protein n=1 Tax=Cirrhinus molitorella TaxID=172907 RepID=A0AA88P0P4_9TELE|nr:hypothetical protein Q8A67_023888 [Cirrhinus molitorella]